MEWGSLSDGARLAAQITAILVLAGALIPILKPVWKFARSLWGEVAFMLSQREIHDQIDEKLDMLQQGMMEVLAEFKPNGGASMRDSVNDIKRQLETYGSKRRAQLNASKIAMAETDERGRLVWANQAYVQLVGMSEKALLGSGWVNVISPNQREWVEDAWLHAVAEARLFDEKITYKRPDGTTFEAQVTGHPILLDTGELTGYFAEVQPID